METIYWTMKNGQKISVDEMSVEHLRNTLKMIIRNSQKKQKNSNSCNITRKFQEEEIQDICREMEEIMDQLGLSEIDMF